MRSKLRNVGLARAMSKLGYCSRSRAAELVRAGKVTVNGRLRRDPETPVHPGRDRIEVEGAEIQRAEFAYFMLNKPRGVVTTARDEKGRKTVFALLPPEMTHLGAVGRLDMASEGLLLLTNDSEWAARITDPASHLEKTYHVQISRIADEALLDNLRSGIKAGGESLRVTKAAILRSGARNSWLELTLDEGRNRHIRRMLEALGIETLRLVRVSIGPLSLGDLAKGKYRRLTDGEKSSLDKTLPAKLPQR